MKTRIKSKSEFLEKIEMATQIQKLYKSGKSTEQQINTFLVLLSELKEYQQIYKL